MKCRLASRFFDTTAKKGHNKIKYMIEPNKNKVLIFSVTYFPFVGGAEVALYEITKRITNVKFDLITAKFSRNLPDLEVVDNITVHRVGQGKKIDKYLYPLKAFFLARKLNRQNNYYLIWAMMANWAGMAALVFKLFHPKTKYFLTLQEGDSASFLKARTWFWRPLYAQIYKKADHIQVISHWLAKRARSYGYKKEISIIPNGVNVEKFKNSQLPTNNSQLKKQLNIPEKNQIIFTSSRLVKKNDIASLIRAFDILVASCKSSVTLVIAGSGKLEQKLKQLTKDLKLENNVIFLGQIDYDEISKYYSSADIFVRSSLSEGQGIAFIEAMAAGLPVISTPVGGITDFLLDKKTGLFCQVKNPEDLAEKIKLLLADKKLYLEIQKNGLELVRQKYDWNLIAAKMKEIFNNLI